MQTKKIQITTCLNTNFGLKYRMKICSSWKMEQIFFVEYKHRS